MIMGIKNWVAMKKYLCFFSFCSLFCSCVKNFDPDLVGTTSDGKLIDEIFTVKGVSFTMSRSVAGRSRWVRCRVR